jgi:hypothetical protein
VVEPRDGEMCAEAFREGDLGALIVKGLGH